MDKSFWYAVSILMGTMVGVGMFALPYVFYKAGFFIGLFYLVILFFILLNLHLMMGEIVLRTKERHRFIGYIGMYLGDKQKGIVAFTNIFGVFGSLLVYILVSGLFLKIVSYNFLPNIDLNQIFFWFVMSVVLFFGVKIVKRSELVLMIFLIAIVFVMLFFGISNIDAVNFLSFDISNAFLPYGVIMYSLVGISAIPLMREFLNGEERKLKKSIFAGVFIPALIYLLFAFLVIGVSGPLVSEDALSGLTDILGQGVAFLGALFGLFAIATSYVAYAFYLKQTLVFDFNISEKAALFLVFTIPVLTLFLMPVGFIEIIIFLGAVFGGVDAIFLTWLYQKAKKTGRRNPEYSLKVPVFLVYFMIALFLGGIFYEIIYNI